MKTKQRLAHSYQDAAGNRHSVIVTEAKFGWNVVVIENGVEKSKRTGVMGSLLTVMAEAMQ